MLANSKTVLHPKRSAEEYNYMIVFTILKRNEFMSLDAKKIISHFVAYDCIEAVERALKVLEVDYTMIYPVSYEETEVFSDKALFLMHCESIEDAFFLGLLLSRVGL